MAARSGRGNPRRRWWVLLLPPVGVYRRTGPGFHFWISVLLTLLGYFPGMVHAAWLTSRR
ncbi:YqaE/Pmp3 family membrane protein [Litchfieldella rifensis]|uniref:YqaE/Pmp3 family membrane protein n=1 Tax=Litchfieldella rifensis TaxID=762643 RepID=A0ABV7LLD3_9GAMM